MSNNYEWTTKDGKSLHITEMETSHITNTMKMIEREGFEVEYLGGGESDSDCWADTDFKDYRPIYENMRIELRMRKLEEEYNEQR